MANASYPYTSTTDWRRELRKNTYRTYCVIALFLLIYTGIGLLIDLFIYSNVYPQADLSNILKALFTGQLFPLVTTVSLGIALISLLATYTLYDKLMLLGTDYREITAENTKDLSEKQLYNVVDEMRIAAGLRYVPKVFIIDANYMNAFASGYSEKSAMIAITSGLFAKLNRDELQAVIAHELSHIRHMDIKLTLTASLLSNLTLMVLDMFFYQAIFSRGGRNSDNRSRNLLFTAIIVLRYVLPIINVVLLFYLSRTREYMADTGCVELTRNNQPLATALLKIEGDYKENAQAYNMEHLDTTHENVRREAYIFDPTQAGISMMGTLSSMFSTHPSTQERLAAIGYRSSTQPNQGNL